MTKQIFRPRCVQCGRFVPWGAKWLQLWCEACIWKSEALALMMQQPHGR